MGIIGRGGKTNGERAGTTVVAADTRIVGDLTLGDSFHLDGYMEGSLKSESDVSIGQSGRFEGDIKARHVMVSGQFDGTIDCQRLEIVPNGRVTGNIEVSELVIEAGGQFSGGSTIKGEEPRQLSYKPEDEAAGGDTAMKEQST